MKKRVMRSLDVLMYVLLIGLMAFPYFQQWVHEYLGIIAILCFIVHHLLNRSWMHNVFRGKYNIYRIVFTIINSGLFIAMFFVAASGLAMARNLPFTITVTISWARKIHLVSAYWFYILTSLHLGLHLNLLWKPIQKRLKSKLLSISVAFIMIGYGFICFIKKGYITYMLLLNEFAFFDYRKSGWIFMIEDVAISLMAAFTVYYFLRLLKKAKDK